VASTSQGRRSSKRLPNTQGRPAWTQAFQWQWADNHDISKLLGAPFGMELTTEDADTFLMNKIDKKLDYWTTVRLNSAGRVVISNSVLISTMLYFLGIWGGVRRRHQANQRKNSEFFLDWLPLPFSCAGCVANTMPPSQRRWS
jgi:hypothetical protein